MDDSFTRSSYARVFFLLEVLDAAAAGQPAGWHGSYDAYS
jgi:hypothetical protein